MKLSEVFDQLTTGELSQISIGGENAGVIVPDNYPKVINHLNLGLLQIYKRFFLKEGRATIPLVPAQLLYPLTSYADVLKVKMVLTDKNFPFPLNDESDLYSLVTPTLSSLRVPLDIAVQAQSIPECYKTGSFTVVYQAGHPKLNPLLTDPEAVELELPESHLMALLYFVASRVNNPIGMVNEFNAGNNYAAKFENECQRLENLNLAVDIAGGNTRIERNGWV